MARYKEVDPFYKSDRWQTLRRMVLKRDGYECQFALRNGRHEQADMVHHIFPREEYPEYQWQTWNLISLSNAAHNMMHQRDSHLLSEVGEDLRKETAIRMGIEGTPRTILVIGRPGAGKTTYVKRHLGGGLVYDLDAIAAAFRMKKPKEERYWPARRAANDLLRGFVRSAHRYAETVFVIRTAPTEDEIFEINPTHLVVIQGAYENDSIDKERMRKMAQKIKAATDYCRRNGIEVEEIERDG